MDGRDDNNMRLLNGTRREPTVGDCRVIDQIVSRETESGYKMIDLITECTKRILHESLAMEMFVDG